MYEFSYYFIYNFMYNFMNVRYLGEGMVENYSLYLK